MDHQLTVVIMAASAILCPWFLLALWFSCFTIIPRDDGSLVKLESLALSILPAYGALGNHLLFGTQRGPPHTSSGAPLTLKGTATVPEHLSGVLISHPSVLSSPACFRSKGHELKCKTQASE